MKKLFISLLLVLLACGCAAKEDTSNASLSDEKDTAYFEYDGLSYTKNDVYQRLKAQSVDSLIESVIAKKALDADGYDFESKKSEYEQQYDMIAQMYGEDLVKQYYGEKEEYVESAPLQDAINIYLSQYIEKRMENFKEKYPTHYVEYIKTEDEKKAKSFQKAVAKGSTFEEAKEKVEFENSESVTTEVMPSDGSDFPEKILEEYSKLEVGKVSSVIIDIEEVIEDATASTDTTTTETVEETEPETVTSYYIIRIISNDPENEYKDQFVEYVKTNESLTTIFQVLPEDHTVNIYDDDFMYTFTKKMEPYVGKESEDAQ